MLVSLYFGRRHLPSENSLFSCVTRVGEELGESLRRGHTAAVVFSELFRVLVLNKVNRVFNPRFDPRFLRS